MEKERTQKEFWEYMYKPEKEDEEPFITWEEFEKTHVLYCRDCNGWYDNPCICYAR